MDIPSLSSRDTALYIFKQFHQRLAVFKYEYMEADSLNYEQILYGKDENGKPYTLSQKQIARKKALDQNGSLLASSESQIFIDPDPSQLTIRQHFFQNINTNLQLLRCRRSESQSRSI